MKPKLILFVLLLAAVRSPRADLESDRAALRVIKAAYEEACKSGDPNKLAPHLGANVTGVMVTGEEVAGLEGIKKYWAGIQQLIGPGGNYSTAVTVENTEVFGDVSLSRGTTDDLVRLAGGRELKFGSRWSAVCRRENGVWKIHRMQASMNPIQNAFTQAQVTTAKMAYGIGGIVAGFLFGLILFRRGGKPAAAS